MLWKKFEADRIRKESIERFKASGEAKKESRAERGKPALTGKVHRNTTVSSLRASYVAKGAGHSQNFEE